MFRVILLFVLICLTINIIEINAYKRHHNGGTTRTECSQAAQILSQWFSQSTLPSTFRSVCCRLGLTQTWTLVQQLLGVPVTGTLDQTTFQALLNTANPSQLAQQLLTTSGSLTTLTEKFETNMYKGQGHNQQL